MIAYLDCFAGISGDMTLGALLDLGVPIQWLQKELERLTISGFRLKCEPVLRSGVQAQRFSIDMTDRSTQRRYHDIYQLIQQSPYSREIKGRCRVVFETLTKAQNEIHATEGPDGLRGNADMLKTFLVIMGSILGFDYLGIDNIFASKVSIGQGIVKSQQGMRPVATPAVLNILKGWPIAGGVDGHEMVTLDGAAILVSLTKYQAVLPSMTVAGIGHGAGMCDEKQFPNFLRVITGTPPEFQGRTDEEQLLLLEACIDDMNPEIYGYLMEKLFESGALDVIWSPIYMKKNRPGTKLEVLCRQHEKEILAACILNESTSLGVRFYEVKRQVLSRRIIDIETPWGIVQAKEVTGLDGRPRIVPEYEVCRRIAKTNNLPLRYVYETLYGKFGT